MSVTPIEEASEEEEKEEEIRQSFRRRSSVVEKTEEKKEEEKDEIPDEIPESQMKNYSLVSLLKRTHTKSLLFWLGFVGTLLRVAFPSMYSYASAVLQGILYDYSLCS